MWKTNLFLSLIFLLINLKSFLFLYAKRGSFTTVLYEMAIYFTIFLFALNLFSFHKFIYRIWTLLLFLIAIIEIYFINTMGIEINKQILKNTFATNLQESFELLNISFIFYIIVAFFALYLLDKTIIKKFQPYSLKNYFINLFIPILLFLGLSQINNPLYRNFIKYDTPKISPINFFPAFERYINTKNRDSKIVKKSIASQYHYDANTTKKPLIAVMIIGESSRADRFSINGYTKQTTPFLDQSKNILSFTNASSCDTSTLSSVPCMIMRKDHNSFQFPIDETGFVEVFQKHGFDTYWFTLQDEAPIIHTFCHEAKHCIDRHKLQYDTLILPEIAKVVNSVKKNTLIVIHTMGSHFDYNERVPKKDKKFQPIYTGDYRENKQKLDNSYDNTIYFIDIFLKELSSILENHNAFWIFSSDHGESLGEKQYGMFPRYGHASPYAVAPKEQTNVPFIVWFSQEFQKEHPSIMKLQKEKKEPISHDNIFYTILGCAGFKGEKLDSKLNLCSQAWSK